jgi:hypothetical protein
MRRPSMKGRRLLNTPVPEDYLNKMPYAFTGTLKRLAVVLEPEKLSAGEKEELLKQAAPRGYVGALTGAPAPIASYPPSVPMRPIERVEEVRILTHRSH